MSISHDYAMEHKNDPAVLCCRAETGVVLSEHNLEDPEIFDDLVDSNLLKLDGALTIGQVMGAKLTKTCDSLTPLTPDCVEGFKEAPVAEETPAAVPAVEKAAPAAVAAPVASRRRAVAGGVLKLHIDEGKGINIELPVGAGSAMNAGGTPATVVADSSELPTKRADEEKIVRSLTRKHYKITEVKRGPETKIEGTTLYIREGIEKEAVDSQELVHNLKIDIITPDMYHTYSNTILDVQPIATKEGDRKSTRLNSSH